MSKTLSRELISAASDGDPHAIAALLSSAQSDIRRYARRTCRTTSDVEDAVQETLIILYRRLSALRQAAAISGWLFTIVHRQCLRLAGLLVGAQTDEEAMALDRRLAHTPLHDLRIDLAHAIESLPVHYREVVLLRDVEELTINEIAAQLEATRETVKARLHRGRAMLREYLSQ
jgi:RNA polymerase sigma factor (sigma-70 family)